MPRRWPAQREARSWGMGRDEAGCARGNSVLSAMDLADDAGGVPV
jgi:hypothetical protein